MLEKYNGQVMHKCLILAYLRQDVLNFTFQAYHHLSITEMLCHNLRKNGKQQTYDWRSKQKGVILMCTLGIKALKNDKKTVGDTGKFWTFDKRNVVFYNYISLYFLIRTLLMLWWLS